VRAFEEGLVATQRKPGAAPERERGLQAAWPEAAAMKGDAEPALVYVANGAPSGESTPVCSSKRHQKYA
jgi:hypothetical protein